MNYRMVAFVLGRIFAIEAGLMLFPLICAMLYGEWYLLPAFLLPAALLAVLGFITSRKTPKNTTIFARDGLAIVALVWVLMSAFGALPFVISGEIPSFIDAFFETVSGFTTTGSTILTDVEALSHGTLYWRSFSHWVGGMGVLVLTLALIPKMGARSIHLMRAESPGPSMDKLVPRVGNNARILYRLYIALSALMLIALLCTGVNLYDSLIHMFGAAGTGGFSNYNLSVGALNNPAAEIVIGVFMALFGVNFSVYYFLLRRNWRASLGNRELHAYWAILLGSTLIIAFNILPQAGDFLTSLRLSFFQVSTIMTTTGYATTDFNLWPQLSRTILVMLMLIGSSAGSTGGGIKVVRLQLLCKSMVREIRRTVHPRSVNTIRFDGRAVDESVISSTLAFFFAYIFVLLASTLIVSLDGFSFETNFTAVVSTLSNIGPGLDMVGPMGNFSQFSDLSKIVLSLCMLIGRLEVFPILMLAAPSAWRKY